MFTEGTLTTDVTQLTDKDYQHVAKLNALIRQGDLCAVKRYVEAKHMYPPAYYRQFCYSSVKRQDYFPVGVAAQCGDAEMVNCLIYLGFSLDETNYETELCNFVFPIHIACLEGHVGVVKCLVEQYAVDGVDWKATGISPIAYAVNKGRLDIIKYFINHGMSVDITIGKQESSLLSMVVDKKQRDIVQYLVTQNVDVNSCDKNGTTPLHIAASHGCLEIARDLIDAGADVNSTDEREQTPFFVAVYHRNTDMTKLLQSRGADPESPDIREWTPLHQAVRHGFYDVVRLLIVDLNVDMLPMNSVYHTAFILALYAKNVNITDLFINAGYDPTFELEMYDEDDADSGDGYDYDRLYDLPLRAPEAAWQLKMEQLKAFVCTPRSLKELACFEVRDCLGQRVQTGVDLLPLPLKLKNFVKLRHVPCYHCKTGKRKKW
ncbi:ankyrin repeat and SOCS box protein 3-like [Haliotis cracherodii]|uniref:poly [ADP-ribose] polymerase tankyrase-1-like n=1 Tax=Haliotis rufescens TaxID=6454 RepID=UPI001EAFAB4D|nr:poly [ADP-ribose] polymerase tankyrase-1-like [Haliotis rufescens]